MDYIDAASAMAGRSRLEGSGARHVTNAHAVTGTAMADSSDGTVLVDLGGDVTTGDGSQWVEVQTDAHVLEGDQVDVLLVGEAGRGMSPVIYGVPGGGDRIQAQVDNAETLAQQAAGEVEQVRQDVADFRDDVATTYATKVEREDGDDAVRTFITTNYTNSNDLATTYATKTLVSQTKDAIELAASQTYETQSDAAATYATKSALTVGLDGIRTEVAEDYQPKGDYATAASMNSAIQQSASSIESSVAATYETKSDASATYATKTDVTQTVSGLDTRITTAQSTADDALADSVEYIVGTQAAATNAWTGETRDAALVAGKTIAYKLPYAGKGTAATLNLTLSGGGTTGAKGVRRMADNNANSTVTTQYGAGAVVQMTYDGEFWRVSSGYNPTTDINQARYRTQVPSAVKAAAAYTGGHFICGTSAGYRNIGAGVAFDLGYPLLYAGANVAAGATGNNNFLEVENRTASNNGTIQSGAANKTLYLKGTVSGNMFTIAASPFMTTVVPTSEDGFCYIPLGLMYSATNIYFQSSDQLYAYTEGAFQPIGRGALATAQAEVTERQTLIRQFSGGVLAGYVGNAIAALVNAAGSFDVVRTAWSGGVPSILGTLARYAASGISLFDAAGNVLAEFASDHVRIGGAIPEDGSAVATVCFFDSDADKGAMLTGYVDQSGDATQQTQDTSTQLRTRTHDADMPTTYGAAGESGLDVGQWLHAETGSYSTVESTATLSATADSGTDPTQTAHASASLGVKAVTVNDSTEEAYLTVNGNDVPMEQVLAAFPVTLYDNASASASAAATLSETAANFSRLTIFFKDNDGNHSSADVWQPNGKRVALAITWINGASTQEMYQRVRWVTISGTSISTYKASSDAKYRTGQIKLGATASVTNSDYISIVHVIGYR